MTTRNPVLPALALAALLAGAAGLGALPATPAAAQTNAAPQAAPAQPERHHGTHARHTEGRIAFLKAELKITPAQEPQFDQVAKAMRENAAAMGQAFEQMRAQHGQAHNAVDRLEMRSRFAALRAQASQRFLDAFKPLYAGLSAEQKKTADELLAGHFHHGRG